MLIPEHIQTPVLCMSDVTGVQPAVMLAIFAHASGLNFDPMPVGSSNGPHRHPLSALDGDRFDRAGIGLVPLDEYARLGYSSRASMVASFRSSSFEQVRASYAFLHFGLGNVSGLATELSRGLRLARQACFEDDAFVSLITMWGLNRCAQCVRSALYHLNQCKAAVCDMHGCANGLMQTTCNPDGLVHKDVRSIKEGSCLRPPHRRQALAIILQCGKELLDAKWDYS